VISLDLARRLRTAAVTWEPAPGDRFQLPDRDMDDQLFVISDMVVEVRQLPAGPILAFNGTTEWALDSVGQQEVVWLPREDQLRRLLGQAFVSLESTPGGWIVTVDRDGHHERHIDIDVECAYARAVLALV
jgi:hypothetical protein